MKNWKYKRLSECSKFVSERTSNITIDNYISTENMVENRGGVKLASTLPDVKSTSAYRPNDILLSNIRPYFCKIWFADKNGSCSNDVLVVRAKKEIDAKFLYYVLSDQNFFNWDSMTSKGTKMPRGTPNAIMKYSVPDISLPTQQKIASILSAYDNLIQNYKKQIEALQTAASELYKEWFVRFRFPGYQTRKFENGIPEGWKIVRFNEIAELINGRAYLMPELQETGKYRIVRVGNFSGKDEWFYSDMELEDNKYCESGDLLYKWACNFGPEIWNEEKVIYHYHIWKVIPNKNNMKKMFLYHLLNFSTPQWLGGTNGTAMVHITKESMEKKRIVLPSFELINEFDIIAENLNKRCRILEQQITNLTQQRDLLLPRLMSGKLEV